MMNKYNIVKFLAVFVLFLTAFAPDKKTISIQPYEGFSSVEVQTVKEGVMKFYDMNVVILKETPLPKEAYYAPRKRYRADKLLLDLATKASTFKTIGLTTKDISCTSGKYYDWGIFGMGSLNGEACVVSTHRLGKNKKVSTDRMVKVVIHEIGHTLNLEHCPHKGCIMQDAKGTVKVIDNELNMCSNCRDKIKQYLK